MEILNIYSAQCAPALLWIIFGVCIVSFLFTAYVIIFCDKAKSDKTMGFVLLLTVFALSVLYSAKVFSFTKIRYEVKIDETISAQELVKDWEIIEQKDDNIWVLERKEN